MSQWGDSPIDCVSLEKLTTVCAGEGSQGSILSCNYTCTAGPCVCSGGGRFNVTLTPFVLCAFISLLHRHTSEPTSAQNADTFILRTSLTLSEAVSYL